MKNTIRYLKVQWKKATSIEEKIGVIGGGLLSISLLYLCELPYALLTVLIISWLDLAAFSWKLSFFMALIFFILMYVIQPNTNSGENN